MHPGLRTALLGTIVAATLVSPIAADAAGQRRCGTERSISRGQIVQVRAERVACTTALQVAGRWFRVGRPRGGETLVGEQRTTTDAAGRSWTCRITEHVAGADRGASYTRVRCISRTSVVRFKTRP
jgi:hypothetical protein